MDAAKEEKIANVRASLVKHDIEHIEKANGHFRIFKDGKAFMDLWATTEKFRVVGDGESKVGLPLAAKEILTAYGRL